MEFSTEEREAVSSSFFQSQAEISVSLEACVFDCLESLDVDTQTSSYQTSRQNVTTGLEYISTLTGAVGLTKAATGLACLKLANSTNKFNQKLLGNSVRKEVKMMAPNQGVIHVTPQGGAIPSDQKYQIPSHYVENKYRMGSYGEMINGEYSERLRIDPATLPGKKGPNYSHYHLNNKDTHYSPRPKEPNPGFNR